MVLQRYCEQEAHRYPDGDLMSQAKILEILMWLVDVAVQQNGARYSFSSVTLPPQSLSALSALDERDSSLFEKQVCSQLPFSSSGCVLVRLYFSL